MKENIIPVARIREKGNTTDSFFQNLIEQEDEGILLDVLAYIKSTNKSFSEEEIEELIEARRNTTIIDKRMLQLYEDLVKVSPYIKTHEMFAVAATLYNKKEFTEMLDNAYGKLYDKGAPETGLPFEAILDENEKETFRKLHRLLERYKSHPEDQANKIALTGLLRYYQENISPAQELFFSKASNTKLFREFDRLPSLLKYVNVQEIMIHLRAYNSIEALNKVLSGSPFIINNIEYGKPRYTVLILLLFIKESLSKFMTEREKTSYDELIKYYGKCKTVGDILKAFEMSPNWDEIDSPYLMGYISMYAIKTLGLDFNQFMESIRISKRDIQEMCTFAALSTGSSDMIIKEFQLVIEAIMYAFNYSSKQSINRSEKHSSKDHSAEVEKYKRTSQELKTRNRNIEKELKAEKELRKKAEEEVQKTKKFYKHTLEKENRSLKRENEDQAEQIKALEERIRVLESQDHIEDIHQDGVIQSSGDLILNHGEEKDLWPDEEKELILEILNDKLPNLHEGTRRRLLIEDVLKNNIFRGTHRTRRNNLKKILRGFTNVNSATAAKLKEQGFTLTKTKTHIKISFMDDPRYTVTMPATGSDSRNGDNLASQIGSLLF